MLHPCAGTKRDQKCTAPGPCAVHSGLYFVTKSLTTAVCADRFSDPLAIHALVCLREIVELLCWHCFQRADIAFNLISNLIFGDFQGIARLEIHPERRTFVEV